MKHLKSFALIAVTAAALVFASSASATLITSPSGTSYTGTIRAVNENLPASFHNSSIGLACSSFLEGSISAHGSSVTAAGSLSALTFTASNGNTDVTVNHPGTLEIHATGSSNGTLTSDGMTLTIVFTVPGYTCRYKTNSTDIGTLTGSTTTGGTATLDVSGQLPFHSGSIFCGTGIAWWTGSYSVTTPDSLIVD